MRDEELATLLRNNVTLKYRYKDSGGWDYEVEYSARFPYISVWQQFVHRSFLELAKDLVAKLDGEVDRETIIKVIRAL